MTDLAIQAENQLLGIVLASCAFFIAVAAYVALEYQLSSEDRKLRREREQRIVGLSGGTDATARATVERLSAVAGLPGEQRLRAHAGLGEHADGPSTAVPAVSRDQLGDGPHAGASRVLRMAPTRRDGGAVERARVRRTPARVTPWMLDGGDIA